LKVMKYVAPTMNDAMKKVRNELGEDAVILNSKVMDSGGVFGLFKKRLVEVIAAIDPGIENEKAEMKRLRSQPDASKSVSFKQDEHRKQQLTSENSVQQELKELKKMIASFTSSSQFERYDSSIREILLHLQIQGINESLLLQAGDHLQGYFKSSGQKGTEILLIEAKRFLKDAVSEVNMSGMSYKKKYINVIGPTGVGKTTTLAKLAAEAVIEKRMKIGFITTDTYRIAAIEQLKTYAGLLNVPVEVVYKLEDYKKAIHKFRDFDHVFIDTAGRNFREKKFVDDLHKVIDFERDMETFLVLSLTGKEDDMKEIITQFSAIEINAFIFTKLDETSTYGSMVNILKETKTGIAYITTGQDVPEDITEVDADYISELLLKGFSHERSGV
jgi:flagellar biosynthesis protein FlhF